MQLQRIVMMICGATAVVSEAGAVGNATLIPMDEPATQLVTPAAVTTQAFKYSFGGPPAIGLVTATPLLCANTSAASSPAALVSTTYYSANGSVGAAPLPFVFGASSATPTVSATASGATQIGYNGSSVQFSGDPLDALVCYGLDANGVHSISRHLFESDFDPVLYNSSVAISVFHTPASSSDYYAYTVDVTIPPLPATTNCGVNGLDCQFALIEGYDTSVFATASGQWCLAPAGAQGCAVPPPSGGSSPANGDININYSNYGSTVSLLAPIAPAAAKQYHFVVVRYLKSGVNAVPATGAPVVMAALFSPTDLGENKLDDNVATGNNTLANVAPSVAQDAAYTTFSNKLASLQENTDSGTLTFDITDADTAEPGAGPNLNAAVTLNLPNGLQVPVTPTCTLTSVAGAIPVNRSCTIDIPLNNGAFWDAFVGTAYAGQFNNVATDVANGTYANGVSASAQIVVTDSAGKSSAPVSLALHINSTKNDAPAASTAAAVLPPAADSFQNNASIPTYACSVVANNCGTRSYVDLLAAFTVTPGPIAAFDELASQGSAVVPYVDGANGGNVHCVAEAGSIFAANGNPLVQAGATAGSYNVDFFLNSPATAGSALCTVTFTDTMQGADPPPFPNSESAATTPVQFRVLVNP